MSTEPVGQESVNLAGSTPEPGEPDESVTPMHEPSHANRFPLALRVQCLTLVAEKYKVEEISKKLGIAKRSIYHIKMKAKKRGFDPEKDPRILEKYVVDGKHTGRPRKVKSGSIDAPVEQQPVEEQPQQSDIDFSFATG